MKMKEINRKLKTFNASIIEKMKVEDKDAYQICPNETEEKTFGGIGALQLRMKNDYERLTRDKLVEYIIQFFRYVLPDEPDTDVTRLGYGVANWIWSNRNRSPRYYLERVYLSETKPPSKRKSNADEPSSGLLRNRSKREECREITPASRDDFLAIPAFQNLIGIKQ